MCNLAVEKAKGYSVVQKPQGMYGDEDMASRQKLWAQSRQHSGGLGISGVVHVSMIISLKFRALSCPERYY